MRVHCRKVHFRIDLNEILFAQICMTTGEVRILSMVYYYIQKYKYIHEPCSNLNDASFQDEAINLDQRNQKQNKKTK